MINLAIVSRCLADNPETFIKSHIEGIQARVFHFYGGTFPNKLSGKGVISMDYDSIHNIWKILAVAFKINYFILAKYHLSPVEYLLAKSFKQHKIQVVLAEYGPTGVALMNVCKYLQIPLITHFHGRDCYAYQDIETFKTKYIELFDLCPYIIAVSHAMENRLVSLGCKRDKIVYIPCCPDEYYSTLNPTLESCQLYSVGRFVEKKAPYATLLAFYKVLQKIPNAKLVMAGDGPLLSACKSIAKVLHIDENVVFPGRISPEQNAKYMLNSCAYVQHSVTSDDGDSEGTPVSVMEASAAGLPVVSTMHAGIPDVIVDGENGLLCDEFDIDSMANNMIEILLNKQLALKLGYNGRYRMLSHLSKKWQMETLTNLVEKVSKINKYEWC